MKTSYEYSSNAVDMLGLMHFILLGRLSTAVHPLENNVLQYIGSCSE